MRIRSRSIFSVWPPEKYTPPALTRTFRNGSSRRLSELLDHQDPARVATLAIVKLPCKRPNRRSGNPDQQALVRSIWSRGRPGENGTAMAASSWSLATARKLPILPHIRDAGRAQKPGAVISPDHSEPMVLALVRSRCAAATDSGFESTRYHQPHLAVGISWTKPDFLDRSGSNFQRLDRNGLPRRSSVAPRVSLGAPHLSDTSVISATTGPLYTLVAS